MSMAARNSSLPHSSLPLSQDVKPQVAKPHVSASGRSGINAQGISSDLSLNASSMSRRLDGPNEITLGLGQIVLGEHYITLVLNPTSNSPKTILGLSSWRPGPLLFLAPAKDIIFSQDDEVAILNSIGQNAASIVEKFSTQLCTPAGQQGVERMLDRAWEAFRALAGFRAVDKRIDALKDARNPIRKNDPIGCAKICALDAIACAIAQARSISANSGSQSAG